MVNIQHKDSIVGKQNWPVDTFVKVFNRNHSLKKLCAKTSTQEKLNNISFSTNVRISPTIGYAY